MSSEKGVYTAGKCDMDIHHLVAHALLHGHVRHPDAEAFDPPCTVIRSRIPDLHRYGWPIKNVNPPNKMADYAMDYRELAERACCAEDLIVLAAKDWLAGGRTFHTVGPFLEFLGQGYRVLQPMEKPVQTAFWGDFARIVRRNSRMDSERNGA